MNMADDQKRILGNLFEIKRLAPGEIDQVYQDRGLLLHDCTTLGGCSGSVVIDIETQQALGLHFTGREEVGNYAVTADIVGELLDRIAKPTAVINTIQLSIPEDTEEERLNMSDMQGKNGYQAYFLKREVTLPKMNPALLDQVAPINGRDDGVLSYTNQGRLSLRR